MTGHPQLSKSNPPPRAIRQRGSIAVTMAVGISILVLMLSIVDIGFMYVTKREYQKAADLAAMAGARELVDENGARDCSVATAAADINAGINLDNPAIPPDYGTEVDCGTWAPYAASPFTPKQAAQANNDVSLNAVRAIIRGKPYSFFLTSLLGREAPELSAEGIATRNATQAQLKIRSTVATLENGAVNALLSSLLGSDVALGVAGWQGVANADVNLLSFFNNILGIDINADIGTYRELLDTNVLMSDIIAATIQAAGPSSAAGVALDDFKNSLIDIGVEELSVPLGDLLALQAGAETSGLDAVVNAFDLVRAVVEIANREHAIAATAPISIPGVAGVSLRASVIEKPQVSVIGNPALIGDYPETGPNRIYVRTAQVRALVSVDLAVVGLVGKLNQLLRSLPLLDVGLLGSSTLDIALHLGGADGWVTGHSCSMDNSKTLIAQAQTDLANASIGHLTNEQKNAVFNPDKSFPNAAPFSILSLKMDPLFGLIKVKVAEISLSADNLKIGEPLKNPDVLTYTATTNDPDGLPEIRVQPDPEEMYQTLSLQNPVSSLAHAISSLKLEVNVLNSDLITDLLKNSILGLVSNVAGEVLFLILDPVFNNLFATLGLNLAEADLGAKMSCSGGGATLVN